MWIPPKDKDPVLKMAPTRKSISLFGAVNLSNGKLITQFEKRFDAMTFKSFLKCLLRHQTKGKKIIVLLDNTKYHHAKILNSFLKEKRSNLKLLFLPPYSPELNPIERVWKLTRRICTHNIYFEKLEQLTNSVVNLHTSWKKPNKVLKRLCCIN